MKMEIKWRFYPYFMQNNINDVWILFLRYHCTLFLYYEVDI